MKMPSYMHWIASGLLFGVSFVIPLLWWCFVPAFVLLLYAIRHESSYIRLFIFGTVTGILHTGGAIIWYWDSLPIIWLEEQGLLLQSILVFLSWAVTAFSIGIKCGVFALIATYFLNCKNRYLLLCLPFIWLISEILGSFLFSIHTLGVQSPPHIAFSYGYLGYLLAEQETLLQLSIFGGVYGLSLAAAAIGLGAYVFILNTYYKKLMYSAALLLFIGLLLSVPDFSIRTSEQKDETVHVVETYFNKSDFSRSTSQSLKNEALVQALEQSLQQNAEVIVFPEDARPSNAFSTQDEYFTWIDKWRSNSIPVIIDNGAVTDADGRSFIRALMLDTATKIAYPFDKKYLVPQGEYLAYFYEFVFSFIVPEKNLERIKNEMHFKQGIADDSKTVPQQMPALLFCYETMVPYGVLSALSERQPEYVVHQISHAWFTDASRLEWHLDSMLKIQAIWNNTYIVTAGNMTESKIYSPSGKIESGEVIDSSEYWSIKKFSF